MFLYGLSIAFHWCCPQVPILTLAYILCHLIHHSCLPHSVPVCSIPEILSLEWLQIDVLERARYIESEKSPVFIHITLSMSQGIL